MHPIFNALKEISLTVIYHLLGFAADSIDDSLAFFSPIKRPDSNNKISDIDDWTDEKIMRELKSLVRNGQPALSGNRVRLLTPNTVLKLELAHGHSTQSTQSIEGTGLSLVFEKTMIPVSRLRRVLRPNMERFVVVMDFVRGTLLSDAWPTLSIFKKIRIAFILRRYIRELRQKATASPTTPPGPATSEPAICFAPSIFGSKRERRGPFQTANELSAFLYEMRRKAGKHFSSVWLKEGWDDTQPLVFSHLDLVPRNIILGTDGQVWVIDWGFSGYYPPWFEYVAMKRQARSEREIEGVSFDYWEILIPFICGPFFREERWYHSMAAGLIAVCQWMEYGEEEIGNLGPQADFPVHEGILNYRGENTVAVALWSMMPNITVSPMLSLAVDGVFNGGVGRIRTNNPV
ncbi:kinase-like protein [Moniliophthora roreri MCA 2997]|uniref:Kinase-like protein n=1 Tax=Moniliophthora roreri (strain MCA 2997) TaxID=1381753 RepID=V2WS04_MONRO|nr:kinase-like protein [Moniliophthora roreri MCA 2997]